MIWKYIATHRIQLLKFGLIGLSTFIVFYSIFHFSFKCLLVDYRISISLAYLISILFHYSCQRFFTFGGGGNFVNSSWRYLLMLLLNYLITLTIAWIIVEALHYSPSLAPFASTAFTTGMNFFMMKYFVFKRTA